MARISIVSSWLCSTGVAVISSYCILTHHASTLAEQKKATDASVEISFTTGELAEENRYERRELGAAVDAARVSVRYNSNVNYYTVRPKVTVDQIKSKMSPLATSFGRIEEVWLGK